MNLPVKLKHVMILTGEPSGDFHAARLVNNMKILRPDIYFSGIGGQDLRSQKVDLFFDIKDLSVMGVTEVILQFRKIKQAYDQFRQRLKLHPPDLIILIDYPGFNLKAAKFAKEHYGTKILYYITPKVWAWKKSRLKQIKKFVDHAALILPFEEKIFKDAGIKSTYVGNPLVDEYPEHLSKPFTASNLQDKRAGRPKIIGLLPGSRKTEVNKLMGTLVRTGLILSDQDSSLRFLVSRSASIDPEHLKAFIPEGNKGSQFEIYDGPVREIFFQSDLVIAASGTVTLEAALCCVPTILIYKMSPITYRLANFFVKLKFAGLANLIAGQEVMPEFLQDNATSRNISTQALTMLNDLPRFQNQLRVVRHFLGRKGASVRVANIAAHLLRNTPQL